MTIPKATALLSAVLITFAMLFTGCAQPLDFDFNDDDSSSGGGGSESDESDSNDSEDSDDSDDTDPIAVAVSGESFTLAWDSATGDISAYEIFYREHGDNSWMKLAETAVTDTPSYEVSSSELSSGTYEFAVRAKLDGGDTTEYHTSLDSTADPESGWYLDWAASL